jgi:hypothetical protein
MHKVFYLVEISPPFCPFPPLPPLKSAERLCMFIDFYLTFRTKFPEFLPGLPGRPF